MEGIDDDLFGELLGLLFHAHCEWVAAEIARLETPENPLCQEAVDEAEMQLDQVESDLHAAIRDALA